MKLQDFSSLVQLGVALHAGTAVLQLSENFWLRPIDRKIRRIEERSKAAEAETIDRDWIDTISENRRMLHTNFESFENQFHNSFAKYTTISSAFALMQVIMLVIITFSAETEILTLIGLFIMLVSIVPGFVILAIFKHHYDRALIQVVCSMDRCDKALKRYHKNVTK